VGHHPSFKYLSRFLPDPFFIRGHKSWTGLHDLARLRVTKRLESGNEQEDILGNIIQGWTQFHGLLNSEQVNMLIAETVTLL
jgi:benzoate 4-monooxygenase